MSKETWRPYRPIEGLAEEYYLVSANDSSKGLILLFASEQNEKKGIKVIFDYSYESYRSTEEGGRYRTLCDLMKRYSREYMASRVLYLVENSQYVDWLVHESRDVLEKKDLFHFAFLSTGFYIDVIASYHPHITHVDIQPDDHE